MAALEDKTRKLQALCSRYESREFATFIAGVLMQIGTRETNPLLKHLMSPMRQLFYLAYLNLTFNTQENIVGFSEQQWDEMTLQLHDIEMEYFYLLGFPKHGNESRDELERIQATMPTFLSHYFNGPLAYQEQELERLERTFVGFDQHLLDIWGVRVLDFIDFYHRLTKQANENLNTAVKFLNTATWQNFTSSCIAKGLDDPKDWISEAPTEIHAFLEFTRNPGAPLIVSLDKMSLDSGTRVKFDKIVSLLSFKPKESKELIYYTDDNELLSKPLLSFDASRFLVLFSKQYLDACYRMLFKECEKVNKEKILKARDKFAESKTQQVLKSVFPSGAFLYSNYSIDGGKTEQDLLILHKGIALIIEVKVATHRPPMRNPENAFVKLKSDFNKTIQYAFDQTRRVSQAFRNQDLIEISDMKGRVLYRCKPKKYNTYSIIVTLERHGHIQTNLSEMLQIEPSDSYPWCVNIDDLEAFILTLCKRSAALSLFLAFLEHRQRFHGRLICGDELEICGLFLSDPKRFRVLAAKDETFVTASDLTKAIEDSYAEGMGFTNEVLFEEKRAGTVQFVFSK